MGAFGIFPTPYFPLIAGTVATSVAISVSLTFQPKEVLKDPDNRKKVPWLFLYMNLIVGSCTLYTFYVALFAGVDGLWQTVVAAMLTIVKFAIKYATRAVSRRLDNPDFIHGTALYTDIAGTCVSSIIFINVNAFETFLVLLAIDTAINLKHCLQIIHAVTESRKEQQQRILRRVRVCRGDARTCAVALVEMKEGTLSPQLVELCGALFFGEVTESIVPLIMGCSSWVLYNLPNCNRNWITYMWQNSEADFNQGMRYVLLDCSVQLVLLFTLLRYIQFKFGVPIAHVGVSIMNKDKVIFLLVMIACGSFYFMVFTDHAGVDTSFQFAWLQPNYNTTKLVRYDRPCS